MAMRAGRGMARQCGVAGQCGAWRGMAGIAGMAFAAGRCGHPQEVALRSLGLALYGNGGVVWRWGRCVALRILAGHRTRCNSTMALMLNAWHCLRNVRMCQRANVPTCQRANADAFAFNLAPCPASPPITHSRPRPPRRAPACCQC